MIRNPFKARLYIPVVLEKFDATAEPTLEVQNGSDVLATAITAGGQAINFMDARANQLLTVDTNAEPLDLITGDDSNFDTIGNWVAGGAATITGGYDSGDEGHSAVMRIQAGDANSEYADLPGQFTLVSGGSEIGGQAKDFQAKVAGADLTYETGANQHIGGKTGRKG